MLESQKWQQFFLHACIVCFGLALETFYPMAKLILCSPVSPDLLMPKSAKINNLTAQTGLTLMLEPVLKQIEQDILPRANWGDYPDNLHPQVG